MSGKSFDEIFREIGLEGLRKEMENLRRENRSLRKAGSRGKREEYRQRGAGKYFEIRYKAFHFSQKYLGDDRHKVTLKRKLDRSYGRNAKNVLQSIYSDLMSGGISCDFQETLIRGDDSGTKFTIESKDIWDLVTTYLFVNMSMNGKYTGREDETYYKVLKSLFRFRAARGYSEIEKGVRNLFGFKLY
jgi:hypothetical protein